jgi:cell division protease FtsH
MLDEMCAMLGGRASEEINFNRVSTGALNDLERVTKQAYAMVSYFGMSHKIGNLSYYDSTGQNEYSFNKPYSEKTAELIDKEVKEIVDQAYTKAKQILKENQEKLTELAELLLEKEVIFGEDLERIFGKRETEEEEQALIKNGEKINKEEQAKDQEQKDKNLEKEEPASAGDNPSPEKETDQEKE